MHPLDFDRSLSGPVALIASAVSSAGPCYGQLPPPPLICTVSTAEWSVVVGQSYARRQREASVYDRVGRGWAESSDSSGSTSSSSTSSAGGGNSSRSERAGAGGAAQSPTERSSTYRVLDVCCTTISNQSSQWLHGGRCITARQTGSPGNFGGGTGYDKLLCSSPIIIITISIIILMLPSSRRRRRQMTLVVVGERYRPHATPAPVSALTPIISRTLTRGEGVSPSVRAWMCFQ